MVKLVKCRSKWSSAGQTGRTLVKLACALARAYSLAASYALLRLVGALVPLVPPPDLVAAGLDKSLHNEHAYDTDHLSACGLALQPRDSLCGSPLVVAAVAGKRAAAAPEFEIAQVRPKRA